MSQKRQPKSGSQRNHKPVRKPENRVSEPLPDAAIPERLAALEQNQLSFVRVFNTNMGAHNDALHATEALIHVLQRVANDLNYLVLPYYKNTTGEVTLRESPPELHLGTSGLIDFPRYIGEYYAARGLADFADAMKQWQQTHHVVRDGENEDGTPKFRIDELPANTPEEPEMHEGGTDDETIITEFGGDGA